MKNVTVAAYVAACPPQARRHFQALRKLVRSVAPKAEERVSYGILGFFLDGALVYLGAYEGHVAMYGATVLAGRGPLAKYRSGRGTLRFELDEPLPLATLAPLVKSRLAENRAKKAAKRVKR